MRTAASAGLGTCVNKGVKKVRMSINEMALPIPPSCDLPPVDTTTAEREAAMKAFVADTPLKRFGTADKVAAMAAYLAADESAYVTGSEFHIDGGILAGSAASPE
jgi:NAD(P)-dependent dehydrogenase (short-subunit alcohol dehydrogenase family)